MQKLFSIISFVLLLLVQTLVCAENSAAKILILGDSLSAAYNIPIEKSWPELFRTNMRASYPQSSVINASISGETTFGGVQRLAKLLDKHAPSHLIIELGGNDGLRGLNFTQSTANLSRMVAQAQQQHISVLLIGVRMPPNFGVAYNLRFQQIFESITAQHKIHYLPRFLEGVAASEARLMQNDGIHPTAEAQPILADKVFDAMQLILGNP
ncbi:MAG: arylesterase [Gammaproteobacteria bacterium]|nr:arylesterase [Gammaproteobacteria bacterium]MCZ6578014.1 arylesterase [Gammaproteobacteria bacterium]MCZ6798678.1 arylesterase [Gammaproteobacteria bacterium]